MTPMTHYEWTNPRLTGRKRYTLKRPWWHFGFFKTKRLQVEMEYDLVRHCRLDSDVVSHPKKWVDWTVEMEVFE